MPERKAMEFDAPIVVASPAGMAAAIRLKQAISDARLCAVEKGSEIGARTVMIFTPAPPRRRAEEGGSR